MIEDKAKSEEELLDMFKVVDNFCNTYYPDECPYKTCDACAVHALQNAGYRRADIVKADVLEEFYNHHYCMYLSDDEVKESCVLGPCYEELTVDSVRAKAFKELLTEIGQQQYFSDEGDNRNVSDFGWYKNLCKKYHLKLK